MYSLIPHKYLKITAFVLMYAWGANCFAQKQDLKCKDEAKEISSCSLKSPPVTEMAADIVKACKDAQKNELTLVEAKAIVKFGIVYRGPQTIPEFEAQLEQQKKSVDGYEVMIKKIQDKIDHYDELRPAFLATYEPLVKRRNEINDLFKDVKKPEGNDKDELLKEYYGLNQKIYETTSSPNAVSETKERYQEMITQYKQSLKEAESLVAKTLAKIEELKNTPEEKRDELLIKAVKAAIQPITDEMRKRQKYKECGFSDFELIAIRYYSGSGYTPINQALRNAATSPDELRQSIIDALNSGLDKIANVTEPVKRGASLPKDVLDQHCMGCVVAYPAFTSTSLGGGFGGAQHFVISSKHGKYIAPLSSHASEEEVLFKSNTSFKILNIEGNNYTLEEID